jgi:hypothetical protein
MTDVYRIGVSIALANGVSPVLAIISRDLLGLKAPIKDIEGLFSGWNKALLGVGAILGGSLMIDGLVKIAQHGGVVNHQLELMKIAGMDNAEIQESMAQAMKTSGNVMTTTLSENLAHIRELRYAFGETSTAMLHLDEISKSNAVLNAVKGGGQDQVWELVKSLEQKGLTYDPKEFSSYVDTMTKVVEATGGKVTPQMYFSAFKYGRTAMLGWDEAFIGGALPRLIQSMSGGGASGGSGSGGPGNALMSAFAKVVQGQMPKKAAEEWARMGLTPGGVSHIEGSSQSIVGEISGADQFMANPYEWVQKTLMPALAERGITSQNDIISEISKMFPVRTASQVISEMALQGRFHEGANSPFEKDIKLQHGAMGMAGYDELIKNDYPMILQAFNQQWKNLLETLGSPLMAPGGPVISAMAGLASAMGSLAQVAGRNSETIKGVIDVVQKIGSIIYTIDSAVVSGLLKISGVAGVFRALGDLPWDRIASGLESVKNAIAGIIDRLGGMADKIKGLFAGSGWGPSRDESGHIKNPGLFDKYIWGEPGGSDGGAPAKKMNYRFDPGSERPKPQPISLSLNVDGRTLAQAVSDILEDLHMFPNSGGSANGVDSWASQGQRI